MIIVMINGGLGCGPGEVLLSDEFYDSERFGRVRLASGLYDRAIPGWHFSDGWVTVYYQGALRGLRVGELTPVVTGAEVET